MSLCNIDYVASNSSPLNVSKSKQMYSFGKATKLIQAKKAQYGNLTISYSCTKICYDLPSTNKKRSTSFGYGSRKTLAPARKRGCFICQQVHRHLGLIIRLRHSKRILLQKRSPLEFPVKPTEEFSTKTVLLLIYQFLVQELILYIGFLVEKAGKQQ